MGEHVRSLGNELQAQVPHPSRFGPQKREEKRIPVRVVLLPADNVLPSPVLAAVPHQQAVYFSLGAVPDQSPFQVVVGYEKPNHFRVETVDYLPVLGSRIDVVVEPVKQFSQGSRNLLPLQEADNVTCLQGHLSKGAKDGKTDVVG